MKVLVISHMYPSSYNSMAGIFVHKQVKSLIDIGCEVKVISPVPYVPFPFNKCGKYKKYGLVPEKAVFEGVEIHYPRYVELIRGIRFHDSGNLMYKGIKQTVKEVYKNFKFDIVHSHVAVPDGHCAALLNNEYKVPHVVTIHGQDFTYTINKDAKCKKVLLDVLNSVNKIITVSSSLKDLVKEYTDIYSKIEVINNGVDLDDITEDLMKIEMDKTKVNILSVSNLINTKGIDLNIQAIAQLKKQHDNINYYIVGAGKEEESLKMLVKQLGLSNNVFFLGKLEHKEALSYMKEADIFCLPSWSEGFGVVYIEAMSFGRPVIGVEKQGIQDVINHGKNGFLVQPQNVEDIVKVLSYLINNKEEAIKIGEEGKNTVVSNLLWSMNAKKVVNLYDHLLK